MRMKQNMSSLANINFDTLYVDCYALDRIIKEKGLDYLGVRESKIL